MLEGICHGRCEKFLSRSRPRQSAEPFSRRGWPKGICPNATSRMTSWGTNLAQLPRQPKLSWPDSLARQVFSCDRSGSMKTVWQGISQAGDQGGLEDDRSGLITEAFNVFDCLPRACSGLIGLS